MSGKQYAAIIKSSYHVEGDERSRTNPGHGYPAHTVDYNDFVTFKDKEAMQKWVESEETRVYNKKNYKIIEYVELAVKTTITVETKVG
jgi:hypothetical protein